MAISQEDILNAVAEMSVTDVVALIEAMEEKFGVSAAAVAAGPAAAGPAAEEQTEFDVILTAAGDKNVHRPFSVLTLLVQQFSVGQTCQIGDLKKSQSGTWAHLQDLNKDLSLGDTAGDC